MKPLIRYIPNFQGPNVAQCVIDSTTRAFTSCAVPPAPTGGWTMTNPYGITVANDVVYIPDYANYVSQCRIDPATKSIISCVVPSVSSWNLNGPFSIAVANNVA